ncbi:MAG: MFS transporter [Patescibacteria group bacterium]
MFGTKEKIKSNRYRRYITYIMGFILSISAALPAYIQSSLLKQYINLEAISLLFVASNIITAVMIGFFPKVIKKLGNYFTTKAVMITYGTALLGLVATNSVVIIIISFLLFIISSNLLWINIDILLEDASSDGKTGIIRTLYLTLNNLGWISAPMISAYLVNVGGYTLPFLISAALVFPVFAILIAKRKNLNVSKKYKKENLVKSFKKLWANPNLKGVFIVATLLNLFYSCAVLYVPIYLNQNLGIDWRELGWMFAVMLLPFSLFELPAGYLADKYLGEKEIMSLGLFIIFISLILFFLIKVPTPWIWAAALFLSRVGAALVDSMRDTYFFKNVNSKEVGFINIFRMTGPLGYIIGTATASFFLIFFPINYLFLIFAAIMIPGFYYIALIKDTK